MVQAGVFRVENFLIRRIDLLITVGEKLRRHFDGERCAPLYRGRQLEASGRVFAQ